MAFAGGLLVPTTSKSQDIYPGVPPDLSQDRALRRENLVLTSDFERTTPGVHALIIADGSYSGRPGYDYLDMYRVTGGQLIGGVVYDPAFVADTPESVARNIAAGIRLAK